MLMTARAEYACIAMMELASRYGSHAPVRLAEIAEKHQISDGFLVQILLQLKAAGLVSTTRGKAGGYHLARRPNSITLADIVGILDRLEEPNNTTATDSVYSQRLQQIWQDLTKARMQILEGIRLSDLIVEPDNADYII